MNDGIIHKIANTIVANLENTDSYGLVNGKMGICIFLYEYALYYKKESYRSIAERLLLDIYNCDHSTLPLNIQDGYAGIGIGLSFLLEHRRIGGNKEEVLEDIDDMLLKKMPQCINQDKMYCSKYFAIGSYLLQRINDSSFTKKEIFIEQLIAELSLFTNNSSFGRQDGFLLHGMKDILKRINDIEKENEQLNRIIARVENILHQLQCSYSDDQEHSTDEVIASLWNHFIKGESYTPTSIVRIEEMAESIINQYPYRTDSINNELAIIGIIILNNNYEKD